jgi:prophage regulatory protein
VKAVTRKTTIGTTKIYELLKTGSFPSPVRIGPQMVRWRESEIDRWIEKLPRVGGSPAGDQA